MHCCDDCGIADDARPPVQELPYGKQRLVEIAIALGLRPTGAAAGRAGRRCAVRRERRSSSTSSTQLPADIAVLIIEHDMELVFRFAARITVLVQGTILIEGTPAEIAADAARARSLSRRASTCLICLHTCATVSAGYGETVVLDGISLAVAEGGTLAVLGRNGVGKTTLLATMLGHTTLHAGASSFAGQSIARLRPFRRARLGIGYVPQEREIFASLNVDENLTRRGARAARDGRWNGSIDLFPRLAERRRNMGNQLSGGEQQMLAIGRALMGNPSLLLLDEPLEGLAPVIVDALLQALHRLRTEDRPGYGAGRATRAAGTGIFRARRGAGSRQAGV